MPFNSLDFWIFFCAVWCAYWVLPFRAQNVLLLLASYVFYGYWDWRFLSLIAVSTVVDYTAGLAIHAAATRGEPRAQRVRRCWLVASIGTNLAILGVFKYFGFFVDTLTGLLAAAGVTTGSLHLDIILPIGISFYTFQTMSYTIDIYRGKLTPTRRFVEFALFVAFFPQLVAGPIERATALLPQLLRKRRFSAPQFTDGLHLMLLGLFKKVYVADNLAVLSDRVFAAPDPTGFQVLCASYAFAFQIYCDFSGYSDIARGCAKCLGIELRLNFNHPYVSASPGEFWRRWHISLSSWLRDYLYIPLGGNRHGRLRTCRNIALTMLLGGLWHGAAWTFVLWGAYHGALLAVARLAGPATPTGDPPPARGRSRLREFLRIGLVFHLVCFGWLIFRAETLPHFLRLAAALTRSWGPVDGSLLVTLGVFAGPLVFLEFVQRRLTGETFRGDHLSVWIKTVIYAVVVYLVAFHGAAAQSFIYFQF